MCHVGEESRLSTEEEEEEEENALVGSTCRIGITARYSQRRLLGVQSRSLGGGNKKRDCGGEVKNLRASLTWGRRRTAEMRRN